MRKDASRMYILDAAHTVSAAMIGCTKYSYWYDRFRFVDPLPVDSFGEMDSDGITYFFGDAGTQICFDWQLMGSVAERHE
jgi:hypothetical protein